MIPINVTHTAIATDEIQYRLLTNSTTARTSTENLELPTAKTPLRHTLNTLITFFAATYKSVFGFHTGPPLHDALTIAYVQNPDLFRGRRYRVDVELNMGGHCVGETVVDVWDYKRCGEGTWGRDGKNCFVIQELDVSC
jgi:uridine nucleosidase